MGDLGYVVGGYAITFVTLVGYVVTLRRRIRRMRLEPPPAASRAVR